MRERQGVDDYFGHELGDHYTPNDKKASGYYLITFVPSWPDFVRSKEGDSPKQYLGSAFRCLGITSSISSPSWDMMVSVRKTFDGLANTAGAELLAIVTIICSAHVSICVLSSPCAWCP